MDEHFCTIHKVPFRKFEKEDKIWYSHKIAGTEEWCKEPKAAPVVSKESPVESTKTLPSPGDNSRNRSMAVAYAKDIMIAMINKGEKVTPKMITDLAEIFAKWIEGE